MENLADLLSAEEMREILGRIHAMVALVETDGALVSCNPAFDSLRGANESVVSLFDYFPERERGKVKNALKAAQKERFTVEIGVDEDQRTIFCDCDIVPLGGGRSLFLAERLDSGHSLQGLIQHLNRQVKMYQVESESAKKIARDKQTEVDAILMQANELSNVDALTFLPNRRMIVRELQNEVLRSKRYNTPLSISVVDVDFFKRVNDSHGHLVGDEALRHIGYQLRDNIRHPDMVGRYGGEEFLILLPNTDVKEAAEQAARLCKCVRESQVPVSGHVLKLTVSIGVAQYQPGMDTWDTLLNRADNAMYEAKKNGRDCWAMLE